MELQNYSLVSEFVLYGLCTSQHLRHFFFILFSGIYVAAVLGNLIIVVTVISDPHLALLSYVLPSGKSFLDVWLASFATPEMIRDFLVIESSSPLEDAWLSSSSYTLLVGLRWYFWFPWLMTDTWLYANLCIT